MRARSRCSIVVSAALLLVGAGLLALPSTALADSSAKAPTGYLPADSRFAAEVDVTKLSKTKYFKQAVELFEEQTKEDAKLAKFFDADSGFDLSSDLQSLAVGLPVSRVTPSQKVEKGVFVLAGSFEADKLISMVKEEYGEMETRKLEDGTQLYRAEQTEFGFPAGDRLVIAMGPKAYRASVWKTATAGAESFDEVAKKEGLLDGLDTDRSIWMVNRVSGTTRAASSNVETAGISIDLGKGIDLQVVSRLSSAASAKEMVQRMEAMKKTGADNPMLSMVGAGPLVTNLTIKHTESSVTATTSMTESELDYLVKNLRQLAASQSRLSIPSSGGKSKESKASEESKQSKESQESTEESSDETSDAKKDGVEADFN
jgi:hypothetical protein